MKVLLYFENEKAIKKSGIGRALRHQKQCCEINGFEYTTNPKDDYDIAHINTYFSKSQRLVKKLVKENKPVIVHGHSTIEDFRNSFRFWQLLQFSNNNNLRKTYSKPDLIVTPTNYSKKLIENYDFVSCPVKAISNGIDMSKYQKKEYTTEEINEVKSMFGIKPEEKVIIGIGWYFERKGIHDFIEVAKSFPDIKFIWFGQRMRLLIPHKINKAVRKKPSNVILPGFVDSSVISKMLHICECFFFPSYEETEGIVLLEALASKAPVLIRDIGAFDYLTDKVDCVKASDNKGFIEAINYILSNDLNQMVENGYELVKNRDIHEVAKELKQTYEQVISMKK